MTTREYTEAMDILDKQHDDSLNDIEPLPLGWGRAIIELQSKYYKLDIASLKCRVTRKDTYVYDDSGELVDMKDERVKYDDVSIKLITEAYIRDRNVIEAVKVSESTVRRWVRAYKQGTM